MVETPFTETIYLKNTPDHYADQSHPEDAEYTLKGPSQLKEGAEIDNVTYPLSSSYAYTLHTMYGIRFKGTNQYAAYRWEYTKMPR